MFQTVPGCGRLHHAMTIRDKACGSYHTLPTILCHARPCQAVPGAAVPGAGPQPCHGGLQSPLWLRPDPGMGLRCHPGHAPGQGTHGVTWPWGCPPSLPGGLAAAAAPCRDLRAGVTGIMTGSHRGAGEEPVLNNVQIGHDICAVSWGRGDPPPPQLTKRWRLFGGDRSPPVSHTGSPPGRDVGPVAEGQTCCAHLLIMGDTGGAGTSCPCCDALWWPPGHPGPPTDPGNITVIS